MMTFQYNEKHQKEKKFDLQIFFDQFILLPYVRALISLFEGLHQAV